MKTLLRRKKPRKLNLSSRNLDEFPIDAFKDKNIVSIDLSNNNIVEIPRHIGELKKLRYLNLENNCIKELHSGILSLPSIKEINLKGNPISHLPNFVQNKLHAHVLIDRNLRTYTSQINNKRDRALINYIREKIENILSHQTIFEKTKTVPIMEDLTFSGDRDNIGKVLKSCVLFVDIRDSVKKNKEYCNQTLAKIYSSFIYGVLRFATLYHGHVRNIIGDRVMIVFEQDDCCDNALNCANGIMYFIRDIMGDIDPGNNFDCGIGIHYGEMYIIKVGMSIPGPENTEYKNMVWIGEPANLASRLTDKAGKDGVPKIVISDEVYKRVTDRTLKKGFVLTQNSVFDNVEFRVYSRN